MENLTLTLAEPDDADILFEWANDAQTRANAFNTGKIEYDEHIRWFRSKLEGENSYIFICENCGQKIGQIRLDITDNEALISYSIAREYRGMGFGKKILKSVEHYAKEIAGAKGRSVDLVGLVKFENLPSQRCFESLGYAKSMQKKFIEYRKTIK